MDGDSPACIHVSSLFTRRAWIPLAAVFAGPVPQLCDVQPMGDAFEVEPLYRPDYIRGTVRIVSAIFSLWGTSSSLFFDVCSFSPKCRVLRGYLKAHIFHGHYSAYPLLSCRCAADSLFCTFYELESFIIMSVRRQFYRSTAFAILWRSVVIPGNRSGGEGTSTPDRCPRLC